jgi:hypothetical protein
MVDTLYTRRCRQFEALERQKLPALRRSATLVDAQIKAAQQKLEPLLLIHTRINDTLKQHEPLKPFNKPLPKCIERKHKRKHSEFSDAVFNHERLNHWQAFCIQRVSHPKHQVRPPPPNTLLGGLRPSGAFRDERQLLDAHLRLIAPFWQFSALLNARLSNVTATQGIKAHVVTLSAKLERLNAQITRLHERVDYDEFVSRAVPYLETHRALIQQRNQLGNIPDQVERVRGLNDINTRLEYYRIKFAVEFFCDTLARPERAAYDIYLEKWGPVIERAVSLNVQIDNAHPRFCRVKPAGTGRVAKTITRQNKLTIDEILNDQIISEYICPNCNATLRTASDRTSVYCSTRNCGYSKLVTTYDRGAYRTDTEYGGPVERGSRSKRRRTSEEADGGEDADGGDDADADADADADEPTDADVPTLDRKPYRCSYERLNHFRECLRHMQALGRKDDINQIIDELKTEFGKYRVDLAKLKPRRVRKQLRQLHALSGDVRYTRFYEHIELITSLLNHGHRVLHVDAKREAQLCAFFVHIEKIFDHIKHLIPWERKNYMSYPFTGYKICELLGWKEYLPAFKLLKTRGLIVKQDRIWHLICQASGLPLSTTIGNIYGVPRPDSKLENVPAVENVPETDQ